MKLNLDKDLLSLDGKPVDNGNMAKVLANTLASTTQGSVFKFYDWAVKLWNEGEIEIDRSDKMLLMQFVESSMQLTILAKAQIMAEIDKLAE